MKRIENIIDAIDVLQISRWLTVCKRDFVRWTKIKVNTQMVIQKNANDDDIKAVISKESIWKMNIG